jgi:7-cyano-7-deazaguanine synthase
MKEAVVLLSGGIDSVTAMAIAMHEGYAVHALSFNYSQRHTIEIEKARHSASAMGVKKHLVLDINLGAIGGSALTGSIAVPKDREVAEMTRAIPVTYVPARNTIFLSCALAWAEVLGVFDIFIGVHAQDYSGYPDCRPEYINAFEQMANLAIKAAVEGHGRVRIHAPLLYLSKAEIIRRGIALGVDFSLTHSCYDPAPDGKACGRCDSCRFRLKGFATAGLHDPIPYQEL